MARSKLEVGLVALALGLLAAGACGDSGSSTSETGTETQMGDGDGDPGDGDPGDGDGDGDVPPDSCEGVGVSNLEGACIWFPEPGGSWTLAEVAEGIGIPYYVIVEADIPDVVALPQGTCSLPGPSGLDVFERLTGNGQGYCLCDLGLCPPPMPPPATVPAGVTMEIFGWTGRNWNGPSDTGNPLGEPFPAGVYTLEVSAIGTVGGQDFSVSNTFEVTLTP